MTEKETEIHCNHFVKRKKRYCRIGVTPGERYCAEHLPISKEEDSNSDRKLRIVCPLDPKHTCYAHNLRKHLKICNAREGPPLPYIAKGINSGRNESNEETFHKLLCEFSTEDIKNVAEKVNRIYEDHLRDTVTINYAAHRVVEDEMCKSEYGDKSKKHLKQASAILGLLQENNLLKSDSCFVEFGAGRGQLSYWLAQTEQANNSCFLLVERSSPKHKRDNKLDKSNDKVQRIRADIADLVLDKLDAISKSSSVVGVTKHLCGDATDLALRCLANITDQSKVTGCIMTFCCHHRCSWTCYTGKTFFKSVDLTQNDFDMMAGMTSWATCGTGFSREKNNQVKEDIADIVNDRDKEIGLNRFQKEEVGKKCKSIINWGRLKYMQDLGFDCKLHYYVEKEVSLENVCIVACKQVENKS